MRNRLKDAASPYLLQHADNPVDWYPWCAEAFERAAKEDKPVFLSVGYSSCHWCHVMARESFSDEEIAAILNEHYISVKVDREERPDVDSVYMSFCQAFTGSGGWPMSVFMTPDQRPFYAGHLFPAARPLRDAGLRRPAPDHCGPMGRTAGRRCCARRTRRWRCSGAARMPPLLPPCPVRTPRGPARRGIFAFAQTYDAQYGGFGAAAQVPVSAQPSVFACLGAL